MSESGVRSHIFFFIFFLRGGVIFYIEFTVVYMYAIVDACWKIRVKPKLLSAKTQTIKNNTGY